MDSMPVDTLPASPAATSAPISTKVVVAGGFGVGKTTAVGAISEITPLRTEAAMTQASVGVDDTSGADGRSTTTVAMDLGRLTIDEGLVLYLFGTPGQDRFWFMWDELTRGAVGALVLIDTRRLPDGFPAMDYFEQRRLPFVVGINVFDPAALPPLDEVRSALALAEDIPLLACDAREAASVRELLIRLTTHTLERARVTR